MKIGSENLINPDISCEIQKAMTEREARTGVTAERALREIAKFAFLDIRKAFNPDGSIKPLDQIDDETAAAIANLEVSEGLDDDRIIVRAPRKKIKVADKVGALTLLARHLGMLIVKLPLKGDAENPLTLLVMTILGKSIKPVPTPALPPHVGYRATMTACHTRRSDQRSCPQGRPLSH